MLTDLQRRKLTAYFKRYDVNQNGFIERADFQHMAGNVCEIHGLDKDSATYRASLASFVGAWESLRAVADKDEDGRINLEEFLEALEQIMEDRQIYDQFALGVLTSQLRLLDQDRDDRLSREEFVTLEAVFNVPERVAEEVFARLDRDEDGFLTAQELMHNVEDFFFSDDPEAPGNWLAGPF